MPSIAPDATAAASFSSPWPAGPTASQTSDTSPFAALLDATTSAPAAANVPANSPPAVQPAAQASADTSTNPTPGMQQPSTKAVTGQTGPAWPRQSNVAETTSAADATVTPPASPKQLIAMYGANWAAKIASLKSGAAATASANPRPAGTAALPNPAAAVTASQDEAASSQSGAANANDIEPAAVEALPTAVVATWSAAAAAKADLQTAAPAGLAANSKRASNAATSGRSNDGGDDATDGSAAVPVPAATPSQPVAAAVGLNTAVEATPVADGTALSLAIGEQNSARPKISSHGGDQQTFSPPTPNDAAPASPSTTGAAVKATFPHGSAAGVAGGLAGTSAHNGTSALQAQQPASDGATAPADAGGQTATDTSATRASGLVAAAPADPAGPSNPQIASRAVKAATADLPNFGLSTSNAPTAQTVMTSPAAPDAAAAAAAPAVTISGLPVTIAGRAKAGSNQFDIRLDPPELGRIDVRLDVNSNGQVTSHITVDRRDTLDLLQSQQPQLQRALEQAGLKTADNGLQFTLRDQSFSGQNPGGGGAQPAAPQLVIPDSTSSPVETAQIYSRSLSGGGIDIRV